MTTQDQETTPVQDVTVADGTFKVVVRPGVGVTGYFKAQTPAGSLQLTVKLAKPVPQQTTGRVQWPMPVACYDVAAAAVNRVAQSAVSSGVDYITAVAGSERQRVQDECKRLLRAALGDQGARDYYKALGTLQGASATQFPALARDAHGSANYEVALLGHMTQAQVREEADIAVHAYRYIASAIPWLTKDMKDLADQLEAGQYDTVRGSLQDFYVAKFQTPQKDAPLKAGPLATARLNTLSKPRKLRRPVPEQYRAGCAPMSIGQYREITGCECDDPCVECRCADGPCPCE